MNSQRRDTPSHVSAECEGGSVPERPASKPSEPQHNPVQKLKDGHEASAGPALSGNIPAAEPNRAATRHSNSRRDQTKMQTVIIYSPSCSSKPVRLFSSVENVWGIFTQLFSATTVKGLVQPKITIPSATMSHMSLVHLPTTNKDILKWNLRCFCGSIESPGYQNLEEGHKGIVKCVIRSMNVYDNHSDHIYSQDLC